MDKKNIKTQFQEANDNIDLIRMQTEVELIESMTKSNTVTIMIIVAIVSFASFASFVYFLF